MHAFPLCVTENAINPICCAISRYSNTWVEATSTFPGDLCVRPPGIAQRMQVLQPLHSMCHVMTTAHGPGLQVMLSVPGPT